jgi:hydroxymethylpyrimidine/phosphomethylpyrimidine kinase
MRGRVLAIGRSDSRGGAGIQGDIKTITALGAFASTAVTALMAQDTLAVHAVHAVPAAFVRAQMECVLDDIGADAVKIGMLGEVDVVVAVCEVLERKARGVPLVIDPVVVASSVNRVLDETAIAEMKRRLLPLAALLMPNVPEAERLAGMAIRDEASMHMAAAALLTLGVPAVLLTGAHLPGDEVFRASRIVTRHTHGTGCALASAVAAGLAQGMGLRDAVVRARGYVRAAIASAPGYGRGHGPLDHAVTVDLGRVAGLGA